ncbi:hypothetical protein GCM10007919_51450 [Rhizobium indigoferae]|nr:IS6 family transposase [Rhizobium indigoferae]GLR60416.1 hypothetical protein GCM10007919_51450 [Rhizobium indigoferae]
MSAPTDKNDRYPIEIVARAVWLCFRFHLSLRDVEEMLLDFGIVVSNETVRRWWRKHGPDYARRIRRKAPTKGDVWHLECVPRGTHSNVGAALHGIGAGIKFQHFSSMRPDRK